MGNTFEIQAWEQVVKDAFWDDAFPLEYHYVTKWTGESFLAAVWNLIKVKRQGFGCVTLSWR